jgi:8-oxo-dGTP pyrophosphatase MutT (NUDIX family)
MIRHFTVTGFVVEGDATLLHYHPSLGIWLPPGGHIEPDEDPVQAVLREVLEETGLTCEVVPTAPQWSYANVAHLQPPLSMLVADVPESASGPAHQHIDMQFVVTPVAGAARAATDIDHGFIRVTESQLRAREPLAAAACGVEVPPPDDVCELGAWAIAHVREVAAKR